jgi:hypothetical protein
MTAGRKLIYASRHYAAHCAHWRTTAEDACEKAMLIRKRMMWLGFSRKVIHEYRLDNPFMAEHARATMISQARKLAQQFKGQNRVVGRAA